MDYVFPFTIAQLTSASKARICSKIFVAAGAGNRDEIGSKTGPYLAQRIFLSQRARGIYGHHSKNFFRRNLRKVLLKNAHLSEQAKAFVTREAIRAEANVKAERAQAIECEWAVTKIVMTSRTVHDVKF